MWNFYKKKTCLGRNMEWLCVTIPRFHSLSFDEGFCAKIYPSAGVTVDKIGSGIKATHFILQLPRSRLWSIICTYKKWVSARSNSWTSLPAPSCFSKLMFITGSLCQMLIVSSMTPLLYFSSVHFDDCQNLEL